MSDQEIIIAIDNLENKSSTGCDGISNKLLKFIKNVVTKPLALTLSDPGYFRQLTVRGGGGFKSPPPTISKTIVSIFTISYMCILPGVLGMFQLEFFQKFVILTILQPFQNKK